MDDLYCTYQTINPMSGVIDYTLTKATWRNGSAFGFDRRRHQKVAGSSPAVVILSLTTNFAMTVTTRCDTIFSVRLRMQGLSIDFILFF